MNKSALIILLTGVLAMSDAPAEVTLRIGVQAVPLTQGNPYRNTFTPNIYTVGAIFDGLTRVDEHGQLQPADEDVVHQVDAIGVAVQAVPQLAGPVPEADEE